MSDSSRPHHTGFVDGQCLKPEQRAATGSSGSGGRRVAMVTVLRGPERTGQPATMSLWAFLTSSPWHCPCACSCEDHGHCVCVLEKQFLVLLCRRRYRNVPQNSLLCTLW